MRDIVSSVHVVRGPAHDVVRVFNRGALAGELVVLPGHGEEIAFRLVPSEQRERVTFESVLSDGSRP